MGTLCRSLWACQYSSRISISSCARPSANTGRRQRPPRRTILATSSVNLRAFVVSCVVSC